MNAAIGIEELSSLRTEFKVYLHETKTAGHSYERVQGILIDTRYLMYHYVGKTKPQIAMLAQSIESAFEATGGILPTEDAGIASKRYHDRTGGNR